MRGDELVQVRVLLSCFCGAPIEILVCTRGLDAQGVQAAIDEAHREAEPCPDCADAGIDAPPIPTLIRTLIETGSHEEARADLNTMASHNPAKFAALVPGVWKLLDAQASMPRRARLKWMSWASRRYLPQRRP